jgi:hypothetical protein
MGDLLLHHPYVQFYLLFVGALLLAVLWDWLRNPWAARNRPRPDRQPHAHERRQFHRQATFGRVSDRRRLAADGSDPRHVSGTGR